ncbi:hypothetical protein GW915_06530 [bacterium]|nr:hypothetical protein [bacterium]
MEPPLPCLLFLNAIAFLPGDSYLDLCALNCHHAEVEVSFEANVATESDNVTCIQRAFSQNQNLTKPKLVNKAEHQWLSAKSSTPPINLLVGLGPLIDGTRKFDMGASTPKTETNSRRNNKNNPS